MRLLRIIGLLLITGLVAAPSGGEEGSVDADVRVGVYSDESDAFVGGGLLARLGRSNWFANPNVEYVFVDHGDLLTLNADFHYDIAHSGETDFWIGPGAAIVLRDSERGRGRGRDEDEADFGLNLLAGVGFLRNEPVRPYIQFKVLLSDESEAVLGFGIRFF